MYDGKYKNKDLSLDFARNDRMKKIKNEWKGNDKELVLSNSKYYPKHKKQIQNNLKKSFSQILSEYFFLSL